MTTHVAILLRPYPRLILDGLKTIESRFTRHRLPPFQCIAPGDEIHFKQTSGPFVCKAVAGEVHFFDNLTPARMETLRAKYGHRIQGRDAFWQSKARSRYGTLIHLRDVEATDTGPAFPKSHGLAWFVLNPVIAAHRRADDGVASIIAITAGAIRNRYLRVPAGIGPGPVTLTLPDADTIHTRVMPGRMIRHRAWGPWFDHLKPGSRVHFQSAGQRRYQLAIL